MKSNGIRLRAFCAGFLRTFAAAVIAMVAFGSFAGCGGGDEASTADSPMQTSIKEFNDNVAEFETAMKEVAAKADAMKALVTENGTYDLYGEGSPVLTQEQMEQHAVLLEECSMSYRRAFVASYEMVKAAQAVELEQATSGLWLGIPGYDLEQSKQPELFTLTGLALLAAGVSISTWIASKKTGEALTKACQDIKNIIQATQNQVCLETYAEELHMTGTAGVTKEAILSHIENHPGRASFCTKASFNMQVLVDSGPLMGTNCKAPAAADMTNTRYEVTQDVTEAGANYSVSMMTTVTSTPTSLIIEGAKVSEGAKVATELGIAITETAMSEYGSTLPDEVTVVGVSDGTTDSKIPVSDSTNTPSEAVSVVLDEEAFNDALEAAMDDVVVEVANSADIPMPTTGVDGSSSIAVPNNVFIGSYPVQGLETEVVLPIPNIGFGTVMVLSPETVPEVTPDVDTATDNTIDFSGIQISQWGEEPKKDDTNNNNGNSSGNLTVQVPGKGITGVDLQLTVSCPSDVTFPATLDSNILSGVSISWGSFDACPVIVLFNADNAGDYNVYLTLKDASGNEYKGEATISVVAAFDGACQQEESAACSDVIFNDSSCFTACPPEAAGYRVHEACKWYCTASSAYATAQCGYEFGCVSKYTENSMCTSKCNFAYAACLNALESDDPAFLGNCAYEQGGCLGPCMSML